MITATFFDISFNTLLDGFRNAGFEPNEIEILSINTKFNNSTKTKKFEILFKPINDENAVEVLKTVEETP